jgi:hypothetical protein
MSAMSLQVQIKSLEAQLDVLKAQLSSSTESETPVEPFAALYGMLAGKSDSTDEDIRDAEYRFDWDEESEG